MADDQSGGIVEWLAEYPNLKSTRIGGFGLLFVVFSVIFLWVSDVQVTVMSLILLSVSTVACLWVAWAGWYTS
jgi:hypothetical protein